MRALILALSAATAVLVWIGYQDVILTVLDPPRLEKHVASVHGRTRVQYSGAVGDSCNETVRLLMIGNSLTFNQDVPEMLARLAAEGNDCLEIETSLYSGGRLFEHVDHWNAVNLIVEGDWTHVLIQPQGFESLSGGEPLIQPLRRLQTAIKKSGAVALLFEPWGYGPIVLESARYPFGVRTYEAAQARVTNNIRIARYGFRVAPVGSYWLAFSRAHPDAPRLLHPDDNHASLAGGFLEALVIYKTIFRAADCVEGVFRPRRLDDETAMQMRRYVETRL